MSGSRRDRITGLILLAFGLIWSVVVYWTIPAGQGDGVVGPRAFPLLLGLILSALAALMVVRSLKADADRAARHEEEQQQELSWLEIQITGGIFLLLLLYGFLMEKTGFLIATMTIVIVAFFGLLAVRKPIPVLIFAFCISVGSWLIFNKLLGTYLPLGSWISLG